MGITLEVTFLNVGPCQHFMNLIMWQPGMTQHGFINVSLVMSQLCSDTTVSYEYQYVLVTGFVVTRQCFSDFIHVMDTGLVVTQQCFPNFNRVMIQALL